MLKCFLWSSLMYECEAWIINKNKRDQKLQYGFNKISQTAGVTNEVMSRTGIGRNIIVSQIVQTLSDQQVWYTDRQYQKKTTKVWGPYWRQGSRVQLFAGES